MGLNEIVININFKLGNSVDTILLVFSGCKCRKKVVKYRNCSNEAIKKLSNRRYWNLNEHIATSALFPN